MIDALIKALTDISEESNDLGARECAIEALENYRMSQGRCIRPCAPCECAPEAQSKCVSWRPYKSKRRPHLTDARIMELWAIADMPCDENDHTTGPVPFARLIEKEINGFGREGAL